MGESLLSSQSCANLEVGLSNPTPIESAHVCISHSSKRLQQTGKTWLPTRLHVTNASKRRNLPSQGLHNSRFLQQNFPCTETWQKVAACDRPRCPEQLYDYTNVQNGNDRNYQKLPDKRRMASFDRSERCVLSRAYTSRIPTFATLPCRQENVSIQGSAIRVSNGTPRFHVDCKRGKAHSSVLRNSISPISG